MISLQSEEDYTGYTAIVPSVAVGNVAQLAVDLIVATLKLKRIGSGFHEACMPILGPPAYRHDDNKTTSFDLYADSTKKLLVFQIRSPLVAAFLAQFHTELLKFLISIKVSKLFILSSSHAYEKHLINSSTFEYLQNEKFKNLNKQEQINTFGWNEFTGNVIFGGGNAKKLLQCSTLHEIPAFILFNYVSEGDNSKEASQLVSEINKIIPLFENESTPVKLTVPTSWQFLFGNNVPELIF